jgi:adenine-specific DNA-methyltransferase
MPTLQWVGKDKVVNHHLDVPFRVLNKVSSFRAPEGSQPNSTDNRIIHGDNLEALKSLLPEFEGKVKCIYIDPPYNTGNEGWVYNDAVNDPKMKRWLGQVVGKEGEDLSRHDKWLCMMYPRLKLLQRLLAKDGIIGVSIDDNEIGSALCLMDLIFGRSRKMACAPVLAEPSGGKEKTGLRGGHEYLLIYHNGDASSVTSEERSTGVLNLKDDLGPYRKGRELRKWGGTSERADRENQWFPLKTPSGDVVYPIKNNGAEGHWRWGKDQKMKGIIENPTLAHWELCPFDAGVVVDGASERWVPFEKIRNKKKAVGWGTWLDTIGFNSDATRELKDIFGEKTFDTPKPTSLIEWFFSLHEDEDALVLDSFAGSGTTAHATLKLNSGEGGARRFILIEAMEYAKSITAERVRRVIAGHSTSDRSISGLGGGFDYYTIGEPIFLPDDNLNEAVDTEAIRAYVAYSEGIPTGDQTTAENPHSPYLLGLNRETAWIFHYEPERATSLDMDFLAGLRFGGSTGAGKPGTVIVSADRCLLSAAFMTKHGIIFKKIPRDITRF